MGCTDPRFNDENFGDQPDWLIFQALEAYTKRDRMAANREAKIHAIGWSALLNGFGGKDSPKTDWWTLLPHPEDVEQAEQRLSEQTIDVIAELIEDRLLPYRLLSVFASIEEVAERLAEE
ncbi:hypothetical protein IFO70_10455 [Phormidium tenue FACHB-886]|nr:hypothetical protein [Phormidium tenue FACHB-886]